jgi:type IX secretion system PorP/SprF family membrane protein
MRLLITLLLIGFNSPIIAQLDAESTLFWEDNSIANPAFSALSERYFGSVMYREQQDPKGEGPFSLRAIFNTRISEHHGIGVNFKKTHVEKGLRKSDELNLNYNYQFIWADSSRFSLGCGLGMNALNLHYQASFLDTTLSYYNAIHSNVNVGVAYHHENFSVGLGVSHLFKGRIFGNKQYTWIFNPDRQYQLQGYFDFKVSDKVTLRPQLIFRTNMFTLTTDLNLLLRFNESYWFGASLRFNKVIAPMVGINIGKRFRFAYAVDFAWPNSGVEDVTHEGILGFYLR